MVDIFFKVLCFIAEIHIFLLELPNLFVEPCVVIYQLLVLIIYFFEVLLVAHLLHLLQAEKRFIFKEVVACHIDDVEGEWGMGERRFFNWLDDAVGSINGIVFEVDEDSPSLFSCLAWDEVDFYLEFGVLRLDEEFGGIGELGLSVPQRLILTMGEIFMILLDNNVQLDSLFDLQTDPVDLEQHFVHAYEILYNSRKRVRK